MTDELLTCTDIHQKICANLELIQKKANLSDEQMANLLESRLKDFRLTKTQKKSPPLLALVRLSKKLNLELSQIYFEFPYDSEIRFQ